jgi:hypothetical protein
VRIERRSPTDRVNKFIIFNSSSLSIWFDFYSCYYFDLNHVFSCETAGDEVMPRWLIETKFHEWNLISFHYYYYNSYYYCSSLLYLHKQICFRNSFFENRELCIYTNSSMKCNAILQVHKMYIYLDVKKFILHSSFSTSSKLSENVITNHPQMHSRLSRQIYRLFIK